MKTKNILVIGCGGIGCELIKILYTYQCQKITLIDYDTISVSNLGRQFFFTTNAVKKYKCQVIAEKYTKLIKNAEIKYFKENIENKEFDYNFYKKFDLVFNCLDNQMARSYVSKRCAFSKTPIVDGGSRGFLGQAWFYDVHTECYDCLEKEVDKEIPVCTIRTFPITYEHCLIWAKQYFLIKIFKCKNVENLESVIYDIVKQDSQIEKTDIEKIKNSCIKIINENVEEYNQDNKLIIDICYEVANLRATSFNIEKISRFNAETILCNIVPIIGTTNSIVASLMYQIGNNFFKGKNINNYFLSMNENVIIM